MNMYPDKKPPSKKDPLFFALGIASFFVVLLTGLILVADYPRGPEAQADANAALIVFFRNRSPQLRAVVEAAREAAMHTQHGTVVDFLAIARLAAALRALDEVT